MSSYQVAVTAIRLYSSCSQAYFTWWVILSLIWSIIAAVVAALLPLIEAWKIVAVIFASIMPCFPGLKNVSQKIRQKELDKESTVTPVKQVPYPAEGLR